MPVAASHGTGDIGKPVFFRRGPGLTIAEIAALTGASPRKGTPLERRLDNINPADRAGPHDLTFVDNIKFETRLAGLRAGGCLVTERFVEPIPAEVAVLVIADPYRAFIAATEALFPLARRPSSLFEGAGVEGALVHPSARLEDGVVIDPGAVVGPRAEIGSGTVVAANAVIGPDVRIGRNCAIGAGASVTYALIGDGVILHAGCRIGQDGFGYIPGAAAHTKIPQIGRVVIQNMVEIGANTTIDRGGMRDTVIGEGTKIDNLVQIGHNCVIGRHCIIVSQTGISGSVTIGDYVMLGGQVGTVDNITIGEGARVAGRGAIFENVPPGVTWAGNPAGPIKDWVRANVGLRQLAARKDASDGEGTK